MKHRFFLQILTSAVLLTGVSAYGVKVSFAQLSGEDLIAPREVMVSQAPSRTCEAYYLFEEIFAGIELTLEQEHAARAAIDRTSRAADTIFNRAESEARGLSESEVKALDELFDDFFTQLEQGLTPAQVRQVRVKLDPVYLLFGAVLEGVDLTVEQEQEALAEIERYYKAEEDLYARAESEARSLSESEVQVRDALFDELLTRLEQGLSHEQVQQMRDNLDLEPDPVYLAIERYYEIESELYDQAISEGRELSETQYQAFRADFLVRLEQELNPEQVRQVRGRIDPIYSLFDGVFEGVELTPEQEQRALAEIERFYEAEGELHARAESEGRGLSEAEVQALAALEDDFFSRLEQALSPIGLNACFLLASFGCGRGNICGIPGFERAWTVWWHPRLPGR